MTTNVFTSGHLEKANNSYFGHVKTGSRMIGYAAAVFITSTIHAVFPFALEKLSAQVARRLAEIVEETFTHHD
tara:strand:+ start:2485 stop:2703 length:219 start_codon:yes stop_codon:yes gene_type:complete